jgi:hypothetical protein
VQLSPSFFMRDFLYSEIAAIHGLCNIPDDPDLAIAAGRKLCTELLEPLQETFGRIAIRSAYRSAEVNGFSNAHGLSCSCNEANFAGHIWDRRDASGKMGATACIVVSSYLPLYQRTGDWRPLAWWIHDHLPYSTLEFFPRLAAFNINWHEQPRREIRSFAPPKGCLTRPGMPNHEGRHDAFYASLLTGTSPGISPSGKRRVG